MANNIDEQIIHCGYGSTKNEVKKKHFLASKVKSHDEDFYNLLKVAIEKQSYLDAKHLDKLLQVDVAKINKPIEGTKKPIINGKEDSGVQVITYTVGMFYDKNNVCITIQNVIKDQKISIEAAVKWLNDKTNGCSFNANYKSFAFNTVFTVNGELQWVLEQKSTNNTDFTPKEEPLPVTVTTIDRINEELGYILTADQLEEFVVDYFLIKDNYCTRSNVEENVKAKIQEVAARLAKEVKEAKEAEQGMPVVKENLNKKTTIIVPTKGEKVLLLEKQAKEAKANIANESTVTIPAREEVSAYDNTLYFSGQKREVIISDKKLSEKEKLATLKPFDVGIPTTNETGKYEAAKKRVNLGIGKWFWDRFMALLRFIGL